MTIIQKSEEEIIKLFRELKLLTNNFKDIDRNIFYENPERLNNLEISESLIKKNFIYFKNRWRGAFNDKKIASKASRIAWRRLPNSRALAAIKSLKCSRRTTDEKEISKILKKNKIFFLEQVPIIKPSDSKGGMAIVDFLARFNSVKIVIETSKINKPNLMCYPN